MRKTDVKKHPRNKPKGGRTEVIRHKRNVSNSKSNNSRSSTKQFLRRKVKFSKIKYENIGEIHQDYVDDAAYEHPIPFTTNPHGADMEMILELPDNKREHHRVWAEGNKWKIESHIDQVDPMKDPYGHYQKDVKAPEDNPKLRTMNKGRGFNDTQIIYLDKN